jgi:alpha-L-rhamnosidase
MKQRNTIPAVFIIAGSILLFSQSCKEKEDDDVKVYDFKTLQSQFKEPPAEYTTAPFFVWNADITKDEIDKFLTDFKNAGSSQVFVHPRPGLITEYLSDKWFDLFRYTVHKGKELGMRIWIYDENSYPSGFGGGHVPAEMPESYNQGQGLEMKRVENLPDTADKCFIVLKENNGVYSDITSNVAAEKGKPGMYCLFYKTYNKKSDWYGGFSYVDLLYSGVTQKFIKITMTGYEKYAGDEFGKTVPGTFTDEPQIESPGGIRFTPDLFNEFRDKWGYDLKLFLPSLYEETGDWKRIRHNYTRTLLDMFTDRWSKPWKEYCESKNLKFTGHYWEHEWPNMQPGGDNMAMYIYPQEPAIDMLFNQFNDSAPHAQFGNVRSVKELAGAASQAGRSRKLSETYGGSGWDLTFADMKRNGDWEFALGINQMVQHLTFFSMEGARKYDYPPTFDYHEPWWHNYKYLNDHYARLSLALSSGKQVNDILVLEPTTSAWLYDSYVKKNNRVDEIGQSFQTFVTTLEKNQVEYDLGSEKIIRTLGKVSGGKILVGDASYSKVVIPPMMENLDKKTFAVLKQFISSGGTILAFSSPSLIDGEPDKELESFFSRKSGRLIHLNSTDNETLSKYFSNGETVFNGVKGGTLFHHTRKLSDGKIIFLVNSGEKDSLSGSLATKGTDAIELNTFTGEMSGYANNKEGEKINLTFSLPPAGSLLLFIPGSETEKLPVIPVTINFSKVATTSGLLVSRDSSNALTIDFCDVSVGNETFRNLYFWEAADRVFKHYGFKNGDPWNTSVQYRTNIVERDTFNMKTGFTAAYHFNVKGKFDYSAFKAVVERPSLWTATLNGTEIKSEPGKWWLDRSFGVYRIGSLVKQGENTLTLEASPMRVHSEIESVYILGDFSVEPAAKGWILTYPSGKYSVGAWRSQGLPFYSWGMNYSKDFDIAGVEGRYEVSLPDWKGTVAEVSVNGKKAGLIAFPPFRTDITGFINQGKNNIVVKVIGSLRNLEGPFHNNPPAGLASPWNWRYVKNYPSGKDYSQFDYGLMKDFELLNGK